MIPSSSCSDSEEISMTFLEISCTFFLKLSERIGITTHSYFDSKLQPAVLSHHFLWSALFWIPDFLRTSVFLALNLLGQSATRGPLFLSIKSIVIRFSLLFFAVVILVLFVVFFRIFSITCFLPLLFQKGMRKMGLGLIHLVLLFAFLVAYFSLAALMTLLLVGFCRLAWTIDFDFFDFGQFLIIIIFQIK